MEFKLKVRIEHTDPDYPRIDELDYTVEAETYERARVKLYNSIMLRLPKEMLILSIK